MTGHNRRKAVLTAVLSLLCCLFGFLFSPGEPDARVKGKCKDCHVMHSGELSPELVRVGCVGCHGMNPEGDKNIITKGRARIPQVIHNMPGGDLAAGNYYYVSDLARRFVPERNDRPRKTPYQADQYQPFYQRGHNVVGISERELPPMDTPPGFTSHVLIPGGGGPAFWPSEIQLTCAGTWGCHGDRTIEDPFLAMTGSHHQNDRVIDGSTVGKSYRFLNGIKGREHPDWEFLARVDDHNGYKGDRNYGATDTISFLCGQCHGKYHPSASLGGYGEVESPDRTLWFRHPTDISFSTMHRNYPGSEYENYIRYSLEAPVAFEEPTGGEERVDLNGIVMCLSCHRAHASPYPDALRWDYDNMNSMTETVGTGCLTCHPNKGKGM